MGNAMKKEQKIISLDSKYQPTETANVRIVLARINIINNNNTHIISGSGHIEDNQRTICIKDNESITPTELLVDIYTKEQQVIFHPNFSEEQLKSETCSLFYTAKMDADYYTKGWEEGWHVSAYVSSEVMINVVNAILNGHVDNLSLGIELCNNIYKSSKKSDSVWDMDNRIFIEAGEIANGSIAVLGTSSKTIGFPASDGENRYTSLNDNLHAINNSINRFARVLILFAITFLVLIVVT
jgi:hypothetical protein